MHTRLYTLKDKANTARCPQLLSRSGGCEGILGAIFFSTCSFENCYKEKVEKCRFPRISQIQ